MYTMSAALNAPRGGGGKAPPASPRVCSRKEHTMSNNMTSGEKGDVTTDSSQTERKRNPESGSGGSDSSKAGDDEDGQRRLKGQKAQEIASLPKSSHSVQGEQTNAIEAKKGKE